MSQSPTCASHALCGIESFANVPICEDIDNIDADVAILGIPYENTMGLPGHGWAQEEFVRTPTPSSLF